MADCSNIRNVRDRCHIPYNIILLYVVVGSEMKIPDTAHNIHSQDDRRSRSLLERQRSGHGSATSNSFPRKDDIYICVFYYCYVDGALASVAGVK